MAVAFYNYLYAVYEERQARKIQRRQIRDICDPFGLPDAEFQRIFRISKPMGHYMVQQLLADLSPMSGDGYPAHLKILCSIQFLASGGYQRQVGQDHSICVAQTTVSKYLTQFVDAVYTRLFNRWVKFPSTEESRQIVAGDFRNKFGVPDVLGVIDCTHVQIFPPPGPQGVQFKNLRKGFHTLNVQLIADSECRIIHVNARYPGRVHDTFVWHHTNVKTEMKRLYENGIGRYFLLGDSGYPLEPWLMTPILHAAPNSPEERYTAWHCRVRNTIERTNGYLKGSLRCLGIDRGLHYSPEKASAIIYACCTVYNIMKHFGVELEEELQRYPNDDEDQQPDRIVQAAAAQSRQQLILNNFFR